MSKKSDSESFFDMFNALGRDMKLPKVDVDSIIEHHRKNLEALQKSASAGVSGATSLVSRQREMLQDAMQEMSAMAQGFKGSDPADAMAKQADFMRRSFEAAVKNAGEVAQIVQKAGTESVDILRKRIHESMNEIRDSYDKNR